MASISKEGIFRYPEIDQPLSELPQVEIIGLTTVPKENQQIAYSPTVLAGEAARTCYSGKGICYPRDYLQPQHRAVTDQVVESTRKAGHLTTRQHFEIVFGLTNVSRQFIWSFPHIHPFYNSEQVSQRYVPLKEGQHFIPHLKDEALKVYLENAKEQMRAYHQLKEALSPVAAKEYFRIFPAREGNTKWAKANASVIEKKAQEVARYVMGVDAFSCLYHTLNALTLMRYWRTCQMADVPEETKLVVSQMVQKVAEFDPNFLNELDPDPYPLKETPEYQALTSLRKAQVDLDAAQKFNQEFDQMLGDHHSLLIDWMANAPQTLAQAVRSVIGISASNLSDEEAIGLVLDPAKNHLLGEVLNLTTLSKLSQSLHVVSYTFAKKISHTADSQDQRHRMVPAARPLIATHYTGEADYIIPTLVAQSPGGLRIYQEVMTKTFATINQLLAMGVRPDYALYRLPNAFPIRFIESGSLLNLHHKYRMRLCFNAQEEIYRASVEETQQISQLHPPIGKWLLAPCGIRWAAHTTPFCPEGERYCGQILWDKTVEEYPQRII